MILTGTKIKHNKKPKKSAWELIEEIPRTPEQKRIDREITLIERKYEESKLKKLKFKEKKETDEYLPFDKNFEKDFGFTAGKIWNTLELYGPLNQTSLVDNTKLSKNDFFIGIGWLARENKISKDMNYYKLGNTNLTNEIGENAGKIWRLLNSQGQSDISKITRLTDLKTEDVYSAIGWLSRENKIRFICKDEQLMFELISNN